MTLEADESKLTKAGQKSLRQNLTNSIKRGLPDAPSSIKKVEESLEDIFTEGELLFYGHKCTCKSVGKAVKDNLENLPFKNLKIRGNKIEFTHRPLQVEDFEKATITYDREHCILHSVTWHHMCLWQAEADVIECKIVDVDVLNKDSIWWDYIAALEINVWDAEADAAPLKKWADRDDLIIVDRQTKDAAGKKVSTLNYLKHGGDVEGLLALKPSHHQHFKDAKKTFWCLHTVAPHFWSEYFIIDHLAPYLETPDLIYDISAIAEYEDLEHCTKRNEREAIAKAGMLATSVKPLFTCTSLNKDSFWKLLEAGPIRDTVYSMPNGFCWAYAEAFMRVAGGDLQYDEAVDAMRFTITPESGCKKIEHYIDEDMTSEGFYKNKQVNPRSTYVILHNDHVFVHWIRSTDVTLKSLTWKNSKVPIVLEMFSGDLQPKRLERNEEQMVEDVPSRPDKPKAGNRRARRGKTDGLSNSGKPIQPRRQKLPKDLKAVKPTKVEELIANQPKMPEIELQLADRAESLAEKDLPTVKKIDEYIRRIEKQMVWNLWVRLYNGTMPCEKVVPWTGEEWARFSDWINVALHDWKGTLEDYPFDIFPMQWRKAFMRGALAKGMVPEAVLEQTVTKTVYNVKPSYKGPLTKIWSRVGSMTKEIAAAQSQALVDAADVSRKDETYLSLLTKTATNLKIDPKNDRKRINVDAKGKIYFKPQRAVTQACTSAFADDGFDVAETLARCDYAGATGGHDGSRFTDDTTRAPNLNRAINNCFETLKSGASAVFCQLGSKFAEASVVAECIKIKMNTMSSDSSISWSESAPLAKPFEVRRIYNFDDSRAKAAWKHIHNTVDPVFWTAQEDLLQQAVLTRERALKLLDDYFAQQFPAPPPPPAPVVPAAPAVAEPAPVVPPVAAAGMLRGAEVMEEGVPARLQPAPEVQAAPEPPRAAALDALTQRTQAELAMIANFQRNIAEIKAPESGKARARANQALGGYLQIAKEMIEAQDARTREFLAMMERYEEQNTALEARRADLQTLADRLNLVAQDGAAYDRAREINRQATAQLDLDITLLEQRALAVAAEEAQLADRRRAYEAQSLRDREEAAARNTATVAALEAELQAAIETTRARHAEQLAATREQLRQETEAWQAEQDAEIQRRADLDIAHQDALRAHAEEQERNRLQAEAANLAVLEARKTEHMTFLVQVLKEARRLCGERADSGTANRAKAALRISFPGIDHRYVDAAILAETARITIAWILGQTPAVGSDFVLDAFVHDYSADTANAWFSKSFLNYLRCPVMYFYGIRPRTEGYDKTYWISNYGRTKDECSRLTQPFFFRTFEGLVQELPNLSHLYKNCKDQHHFSRKWTFEINDVAYYIPYFSFPAQSVVACTAWSYCRFAGRNPAPFGEGVVTTIAKTRHDLADWVKCYSDYVHPQWEEDRKMFEAGKVICPGWSWNNPTGGNKNYGGWNVTHRQYDRSIGFGIHDCFSWYGVGSDFCIQVIPSPMAEHCENFSCYELLRRRLALKATSLDAALVKSVLTETELHFQNYIKFATTIKKSLAESFDDGDLKVSTVFGGRFKYDWARFVARIGFGIFPNTLSTRKLVLRASTFLKPEVSIDTKPAIEGIPWGFLGINRLARFVGSFFDLPLENICKGKNRKALHVEEHMWAAVGELKDAPDYLTALEEYYQIKPVESHKLVSQDIRNDLKTPVIQTMKKIEPQVLTSQVSPSPCIAETSFGFYVKRMNPKDVIPVTARALPFALNPQWQTIRQSLIDWYQEEECKEEHKTARKVPAFQTGFRLRTKAGLVTSYEFDAKNSLNKVYAAFARQLASKNSPDPIVLQHYEVMMAQFFDWLSEQLDEQDEPAYKAVNAWIEAHTDWTKSKKSKYMEQIVLQLKHPIPKNFKGAFEVIVKAGEVWMTLDINFKDGEVVNVSERPRAISNPSDHLCGLMTYIQSAVIFPMLKKAVPGFIHAKNCHDLVHHFEENLNHVDMKKFKSVSFDGSGFDSNQHVEIQKIVDSGIYRVFEKHILNYLERNHLLATELKDQMAATLKQAWTNYTFDWYLQVPGISKFYDNRDDNKQYQRVFGNRTNDAVKLTLQGTTFSGHPTLTTLGNTVRSLSYLWFTLWSLGMKAPWKKNDYAVCIAAGDDSVFFAHERIVPSIERKLKELFAPNKKLEGHGLGQCIDAYTIKVSDVHDFDFCSKWTFFTPDGQWVVTRDYSKLLWSKQEYYGSCDEFLADPTKHAEAILGALEAEGLNRGYLWSICQFRASRSSKSSIQDSYNTWIENGNSWAKHYQSHEELPDYVVSEIDRRLGLTEASVLAAYRDLVVTIST